MKTLHRLNCDERVYRYLLGRPITREESEAQLERYRRHWEEHDFGLWSLEEKAGGRLVGGAGLSYHRLWRSDPELGWMLDPDVWGRGYATEAGAAALRHGFEELGFDRVVSIIHPENEPSFRVARRLAIASWREVAWDDTGITLQVYAVRRSEWSRLQSPG
ncbi:MAG: GNAT family N-acetyltransferase [Actinobacteria bacterium]|nr:GNAT family N-acetyltransferase [Actinomycetota bacterium]